MTASETLEEHTHGPARISRRARKPDISLDWDPDAIRKLLPAALRIRDYYNGSVSGFENIPQGGYIIAGAHGGGPMTVVGDTLVLLSSFHEYFRCQKPLYILTHHALARAEKLARLLAKCGAIDGTPRVASKILRQGAGCLLYPGGEQDMARTWQQRNTVDFRSHVGFIRLAIANRVPILPLGSIGGHETEVVIAPGEEIARWLGLDRWAIKSWPLAFTFPWGLQFGYYPYLPMPATIRLRIGTPLMFTPSAEEREDPDYLAQAAKEVERAAQRLTDDLLAGGP